ncbi:MAG: Uma2 family endonuclease [Nakamurella sp.]
MTPMTVMPRESVEWTVDDLDLLPDDGLQYELLDGLLLVSPAPTRRHQRAAFQLGLLLTTCCPPEMEVLLAPLDWRPENRTSLQPDVLVLGNRNLESTAADSMILAVEVLSPSTRRKDTILKRSKYEDEGVASYWIIDPEAPSITALELVDGRYVTVGAAAGDDPLTVEKPFSFTVVPSALIR